MTATNRKLIIASSVLLILKTIICITILILAVANLSYISWYFFQLFFTNGITFMSYANFKTLFVVLGYYSGFAIIVNSLLVIIFLNLLYKPSEFFNNKKNIFTYISALTLLFGGIISFVLVLKALVLSNNAPAVKNTLAVEELTNYDDATLLQIARVNELFMMGLLTLDQHDLLLENITSSKNTFDFDAFYEEKLNQNKNNNDIDIEN